MSFPYADIAFPTAVRKVFTYQIPDGMTLRPGVRVLVPLRKEQVIGMVVRVHGNEPSFRTRPVTEVIDADPVLNEGMLRLTEWIHRFYYCSWGEAIQAALPAGLNFVADKWVRVTPGEPAVGFDPAPKEEEILREIGREGCLLTEARKRWRAGGLSGPFNSLIRRGILEVLEVPRRSPEARTARHWTWADGAGTEEILRIAGENRGRRWAAALEILLETGLPAPHQELLQLEGVTDYSLRRMQQEGLIVAKELPLEETPAMEDDGRNGPMVTLSQEQQEVYDTIREALDEKSFRSMLLYGVTGSGKTEVYIHALSHLLSLDRGGMILVPEIALTPQTVRRFRRVFGNRIAVLHSRLNDRERHEAWSGLQSGEKLIVIGPRSAVFAPVRNLGMIVVDEEHDSSYKQFDPAPRYHARDVALMRAQMEGAVVVMGSATPSMAALNGVRRKKHTFLRLSSRPSGKLPKVDVLDMKEYGRAMRGPLTVRLFEEIREALAREEQIILLYNRRGFASYLLCRECGHIPMGPESSVALTWHKNRNLLLCHYTGYSRRAESRCSECDSEKLEAVGSGTQQIEEEIAALFPEARLLRMDRDTTSGKHSHRRIYESFLNREADILIGTQLVSKGLDFPGVTVVGVLGVETELAFPSFRSGERLFQLLSQVAGRAGRGEREGRVFIQTWKPDHHSVLFAAEHDYPSFAKKELAERRMLGYPPFSRMIVFHFRGESERGTARVAELFSEAVREVTKGAVLGPSPAVIEQVRGLWQWETHLKVSPALGAEAIENLIDRIFARYEQLRPKGGSSVRIAVDVDAVE